MEAALKALPITPSTRDGSQPTGKRSLCSSHLALWLTGCILQRRPLVISGNSLSIVYQVILSLNILQNHYPKKEHETVIEKFTRKVLDNSLLSGKKIHRLHVRTRRSLDNLLSSNDSEFLITVAAASSSTIADACHNSAPKTAHACGRSFENTSAAEELRLLKARILLVSAMLFKLREAIFVKSYSPRLLRGPPKCQRS